MSAPDAKAAKLEAITALYCKTIAKMDSVTKRARRKGDAFERHEALVSEALCFVVAVGEIIDAED